MEESTINTHKHLEPIDMLKEIFNEQKMLQMELGTYNRMKESPEMNQKYINQMILAIHEEAVEIMRETMYKNPDMVEFGWKKGQQGNDTNYLKEIADLLHFVVNLCLARDITAEQLFESYIGKRNENYERKQTGY